MDSGLLERIAGTRALPSPPVIAARLIALGDSAEASVADLVEVLRPDPALTARLLRLANSPLYAPRRRVDSLHQAVVMLGVDAVFTAALSLTLISDQHGSGPTSAQLLRAEWTRSVHAAIASQVIARRIGGVLPGDAFLAGLMQDIGVLVAYRLDDTAYRGLATPTRHAELVAREVAEFGADHAAIGAALLESWQLPSEIVDAVRRSHVGGNANVAGDRLVNIVALGGLVADWIAGDPDALLAARGVGRQLLDLDDHTFSDVVDAVTAALPELAGVLDAEVPPADVLAEMAADALVARQLRQQHALDQIREDLVDLTEVTRQLEIAARTDALTGLLNRRHLDSLFANEFRRLPGRGGSFALMFIDLDDFKSINDTHGHHAGDQLLRCSAELVADIVRNGDLVGRFGGDEFVVILPDTTGAQAEALASRLVASFAASEFELDRDVTHQQDITIGLAATDQLDVTSVDQLLRAADRALLVAKHRGKAHWHNAAESSGV